jgi:hypothetical protein
MEHGANYGFFTVRMSSPYSSIFPSRTILLRIKPDNQTDLLITTLTRQQFEHLEYPFPQ